MRRERGSGVFENVSSLSTSCKWHWILQTSCQCPLKRPLPGLAQDLLESSPEVLVEDGVDDRD